MIYGDLQQMNLFSITAEVTLSVDESKDDLSYSDEEDEGEDQGESTSLEKEHRKNLRVRRNLEWQQQWHYTV